MKITDAVLEAISEQWGCTPEQIRGTARLQNLVTARHIAMYALRQTKMSYPVIAKELGGRDHTTVMHGVAKIERFMTSVPVGNPMRLAIIDLVELAEDNLEPRCTDQDPAECPVRHRL